MGRFSDRPIKALFQESIGVGNPYLFVTVYMVKEPETQSSIYKELIQLF